MLMTNVREQLETLVKQNFKDAWEEWKTKHILDLVEKERCDGQDFYCFDNAIIDTDWQDLFVSFRDSYFEGIMQLICFAINDKGELIDDQG